MRMRCRRGGDKQSQVYMGLCKLTVIFIQAACARHLLWQLQAHLAIVFVMLLLTGSYQVSVIDIVLCSLVSSVLHF